MERYTWNYLREGLTQLLYGNKAVLTAYASARDMSGRKIDSRSAKLVSQEVSENGELRITFLGKNGLLLTQVLSVSQDGIPTAYCVLEDRIQSNISSNYLMPLCAFSGEGVELELWNSLWSQMVQVPYDNTMWLRYEAVPLRSGRKSYDYTVLIAPDKREGLLLGSLDFDTWKNAIVCSPTDARHIQAVCGIADEGTHDALPHGAITGTKIQSSRFCVMYGRDYRDLLEAYGDLAARDSEPMQWHHGIPFGFNSWAGHAMDISADTFSGASAVLEEKLKTGGYENAGVQYINFDAGWQKIPEEDRRQLMDTLRARGQKSGIYDAPFAFFGKDVHQEIQNLPGHIYEEILLKDKNGKLLPRVDGAIPFDVTHPLWRRYTENKVKQYMLWGYDYIKLDFLTHGGMEGCHYNTNIQTGRQAITSAYEFLRRLYSEERMGKPVFVSISISPLFPNRFGHARRFSCDAFGTEEDVEYVLNAQTWAWWQNKRIYAFNDPDHISLYKSCFAPRNSLTGEARARYTTAAISGGVMMLSDDFSKPGAMERVSQFAANSEVNAIVKCGISFRPLFGNGCYGSNIFTAEVAGRKYIAWFSWSAYQTENVLQLKDLGMDNVSLFRDLWTGNTYSSVNGTLNWNASGCDAILLEEMKSN